jgi:hypothetical protein
LSFNSLNFTAVQNEKLFNYLVAVQTLFIYFFIKGKCIYAFPVLPLLAAKLAKAAGGYVGLLGLYREPRLPTKNPVCFDPLLIGEPREGDCIQPLPTGRLPVAARQGIWERPRNTWDALTSLGVEAGADDGAPLRRPPQPQASLCNITCSQKEAFASQDVVLPTIILITVGSERSSPTIATRTLRCSAHAGQTSSVFCAVSSSQSQ